MKSKVRKSKCGLCRVESQYKPLRQQKYNKRRLHSVFTAFSAVHLRESSRSIWGPISNHEK